MQQKDIVQETANRMKKKYNLTVGHADVYIAEGIVYLSTQKLAQVFKTGYTNFTSRYAKPIVQSGVKHARLGKHKYYELEGCLSISSMAIDQGKCILEVCEDMKKKNKKRKK